MLYGRPLKHIRHSDESTITLEPQRFFLHLCWKFASTATTRVDGQDLKDSKECPLGSKITKHKWDILITPETIEPQQLYIGRLKLSFNDIYQTHMSGSRIDITAYQGTPSMNNITTAITCHLFPSVASSTIRVDGHNTANQEIGGAGSGFGITEWMLDENIKHSISLKKVTVFDQRPLMGERWQRIPSKVKRINEGTLYGVFFFNDSIRGGTPADTQVKINIKEYWEELAI